MFWSPIFLQPTRFRYSAYHFKQLTYVMNERWNEFLDPVDPDHFFNPPSFCSFDPPFFFPFQPSLTCILYAFLYDIYGSEAFPFFFFLSICFTDVTDNWQFVVLWLWNDCSCVSWDSKLELFGQYISAIHDWTLIWKIPRHSTSLWLQCKF